MRTSTAWRAAIALALLLALPATIPAASWSLGARSPIKTQENGVTVLDGWLYVAGGLIGKDFQPKPYFMRYSIAGDRWEQLPDLPVATHHTTLVGHQGTIYIIYGLVGKWTPSSLTYAYDIASRTFTRLPDRPIAAWAQAGAVYDGRIWVFGGATEAGAWSPKSVGNGRTCVFDPATRTWTTKPGTMILPRDHIDCAVVGDRCYVGPGRWGDGAKHHRGDGHVEVYDFKTDTWQMLSTGMPQTVRHRSGGGFTHHAGKLYFIGGENGSTDHSPWVDIFDIATATWTAAPDIPDGGAHGTYSESWNGRIYFPCGARHPGMGTETDLCRILTLDATLAPPTAPASLVATAVSANRIELAWSDRSGDEDGFRIERDGSVVATVAANATAWSDDGLAASTTHAYRVQAFNAAGGSAWTALATATTPAGGSSTAFRFDCGTSSSPVVAGWTRVTIATLHTSAIGHGWAPGAAPNGDRDRGTGADGLHRDFSQQSATADTRFLLDLPAGTYRVRVVMGDLNARKGGTGVWAEGTQQVEAYSTAAGEWLDRTFSVVVDDGQLELVWRTTGADVAINAIEVVQESAAEEEVSYAFDCGKPGSPTASGHLPITIASLYAGSIGYGWAAGGAPDGDRDRGTGADDLRRDFSQQSGVADTIFLVDLPDGTYQVRVVMGDLNAKKGGTGVWAEGTQVVGRYATAAGEWLDRTFTVTVDDGRLELVWRTDGADEAINAIVITGGAAAPIGAG